MASGIRDLKVWQEAVALAGEVVRAFRASARRETKVLSDLAMQTATAAASLVAEGYGRYTPSEQRQVYRAARRELLRLETQLAIARRAEMIPAAQHADLSHRVQAVSRLLAGYLVYLERQRSDESIAAPASK